MPESGLPLAAFLVPRACLDSVYGAERIAAIGRRARLLGPDPCLDPDALGDEAARTRAVEIVFSTWGMPALTGAQFTVAQIVLAMKGYFRNVRDYDGSAETYGERGSFRGRGLYGECVVLLGAGAIGRLVAEMLRSYDVTVLVWDPFLDDAGARWASSGPRAWRRRSRGGTSSRTIWPTSRRRRC